MSWAAGSRAAQGRRERRYWEYRRDRGRGDATVPGRSPTTGANHATVARPGARELGINHLRRSGGADDAVAPGELFDMNPHALGGQVGIAVTHGLEEPAVLLEVPLTESLEAIDTRAALDHERHERLNHRSQHLVVRGGGEEDVERRGNVDERIDVASQPRLLHLERGGEPRQILVGAAPGGESRDLHLNYQSGFDELMCHSALESRGDRRRFVNWSRLAGDEYPLAVADLDDPQHGKSVQRLADGRTSYTKLLCELTFRRDLRTWRKLANRGEELFGNGLCQLSARSRRQADLGDRLLHRNRIDQQPVVCYVQRVIRPAHRRRLGLT